MSTDQVKRRLKGIASFRFFKALRNVAAHHSVLAATIAGNKFPKPFSRHINVSVGGPPNDSSRLKFRPEVMRQILEAVESERPREKDNIEAARSYISELENRNCPVYLEDVMAEAITAVRTVIPDV